LKGDIVHRGMRGQQEDERGKKPGQGADHQSTTRRERKIDGSRGGRRTKDQSRAKKTITPPKGVAAESHELRDRGK